MSTDHFVLEQRGKLVPDSVGVGVALPAVRDVVDLGKNVTHEKLWAPDLVLKTNQMIT